MELALENGLSIRSFDSMDEAFEAGATAPVIRSIVQDEVVVTPTWLRVLEDGKEHYFAAFVIQKLDRAGEVESEGILFPVYEGEELSSKSVWVPPALIDGERFSLHHFSKGTVSAV